MREFGKSCWNAVRSPKFRWYMIGGTVGAVVTVVVIKYGVRSVVYIPAEHLQAVINNPEETIELLTHAGSVAIVTTP